jgi:hypothetical protein
MGVLTIGFVNGILPQATPLGKAGTGRRPQVASIAEDSL